MSTTKKAAPRTAARKPAAVKPAEGPASRGAVASAKPRAAVLPSQTPAEALRLPGPDEAVALLPRVKEIDSRLQEVERAFARAREGFSAASRARSISTGKSWSPTGPRAHAQAELTEHATEMRLLTARRAELLWVRQLLVEGGPAGR